MKCAIYFLGEIIMSNLRLGAENALKGVYAHEDNKNEAKATYKNAFEHLLESLGYYYRCAQYGNSDEAGGGNRRSGCITSAVLA